jgi:ribosomal protein S18 acetylase RimI-like enzyme
MIVPLLQEHCPTVARLHMDCLPTGFRGRPGLELLAAYYRAVVESKGGCGFVAGQAGRVVGYVCGVWEPAAVRVTLFRAQWPALVLWGCVQMLACPRLFSEMVGRLGNPAGGSEPAGQGYELRPIVVAPEARRSGIGVQLLERLLQDADQRGFDRVFLAVQADNAAADAFYQKAGFRLMGKESRSGEVYLRYEVSLPSS